VNAYGGADQLRFELGVTKPQLGEGQALVKIEIAGINFIDVYVRGGVYKTSETYRNTPPFVPGMEGGGTVEAVGPGVANVQAGDRVAYCLALGSYAEYAAVPAWRLVKVPAEVDMPTAVTLMLQGMTAHYLSHSLYPLGPGKTCLVHAGAGGVGQLLTQIAKIRGARVLSTVSTPEKAAISSRHGGEPIMYRDQDFAERALEMTDGEGVDVVYDGIGQMTIKGSMKAAKRRGTVVLFGGASGAVRSIDPLDLAEAGSIFLTRPHLWDYTHDAAEIAQRSHDLFEWIRSGRLKVAIDREFPLADAKSAHDYLEAGKTVGKLLLKV
ncbi:MAG: quinone oxidoreductase, partial [Proteobacteria bacterium]|nr:quinone oxidoreductase [Pseudomonadota bacterium]